MSDNKLQSPQHATVRTVLRVVGPIVAGLGLVLTVIGLASFFSSFGSFEPPRYFWCAFLGLPLLALGIALCKFGYLGAIARYMMGESAPVVKDTANYIGEGIQPGVKAIARAAADGVLEAQRKHDNEKNEPRP